MLGSAVCILPTLDGESEGAVKDGAPGFLLLQEKPQVPPLQSGRPGDQG